MSQTERLYWIDAQIRDRQYPNADAVCAFFGVSRRTAFADRDLLLQRLNAPLVYNRRRAGWVYTDDTFILPFLAFTEPEAAALRRSLRAAQEYLSGSDAQAVSVLLARLLPYLSAPLDPESIGGAIHFYDGIAAEPALLEACRHAVRNRKRLHLHYRGAHRDEPTERIVRPYHLHNYRGEWHLIAWCELRGDFRQFFLGRVQTWDVLEPDRAFVRDGDFDIDAYLSKGLGLQHGTETVTIRARFTPYQARWIRERRYHSSQEIEEHSDGGLILTLRVAGMEEARRWLLSYGEEVEVLEPVELREQIAAQAKKIQEIYGSGSECSPTALKCATL